ncbi:MAG: hypothetical protein Q8P54_02720, partial [bacterium]|nr:hypothetical protein [bacterium]
MIEFTSIMSARIEEIERSFGDLYKYFSRGAAAYSGFLFPEDDPYPVINGGGITHILAKMIAGYYKWLAAKDTTDENTVSLAKKYFHLSLDDGEVIITPCSANEVQEKFGGREYFFRRGAKILDTGCGVGKAVAELTEIYKERGVK